MKRTYFTLAFLFVFSALALGQAKPTDKFAWQQDAGSLAAAQAYRYDLELDGTVQTLPLVATCAGINSPFACDSPIPAVTPSSHTVRIRAVDISNTTAPLVGDWSDPFTFTMKALPSKPIGVHIVPGN